MKTEPQKNFGLCQLINSALAELDLRGRDAQVTRAMAIVTEAFRLHANGRPVDVAKLLSTAEQAVAECADCAV
ncbi:MAG: hypothetical protein OD918_09880 [Gammaproteobacteria bacterium]